MRSYTRLNWCDKEFIVINTQCFKLRFIPFASEANMT